MGGLFRKFKNFVCIVRRITSLRIRRPVLNKQRLFYQLLMGKKRPKGYCGNKMCQLPLISVSKNLTNTSLRKCFLKFALGRVGKWFHYIRFRMVFQLQVAWSEFDFQLCIFKFNTVVVFHPVLCSHLNRGKTWWCLIKDWK